MPNCPISMPPAWPKAGKIEWRDPKGKTFRVFFVEQSFGGQRLIDGMVFAQVALLLQRRIAMRKVLFSFLVFVLLLAGCAPISMAGSAGSSEEVMAYDMAFAPAAEPMANYEYDSGVSNAVPAQKRMVIENAELSIVVVDPQASMQSISAMAERLGGFVVSSNMFQTSTSSGKNVPEGSLTIRVPAEKLNEALAEIKTGIVELRNENRSGQDVTQEYTDMSSRLKNLENTERQLNSILQQAEKTEDVMLVFNQLNQIREQIEVIKGQMQYYEQSAALSSISIRLIAEETINPIEVGGWKPQGVIRDAAQALVDFLKGFFEFVVWLVIVFIPAGVLILLVLFVLWRLVRWLWHLLFRDGFKRAKPVAPPAEEEPTENQ